MQPNHINSWMRFLLALILAFLFPFVFTPTPPAHAAFTILRVAAGGSSTDPNCGTTWESACDLQYALTSRANTTAGDTWELWVKTGTYYPTNSPTHRAAAFEMKSGVAVYGGFRGDETARDERRPDLFALTTLSGDIDGSAGMLHSYNVVRSINTDASAVLDGFLITGGVADKFYELSNDRGGGIFISNSHIRLTNLIIGGNQAEAGGGIYVQADSRPTLNQVNFLGNYARQGGGMYNVSGASPLVVDAVFLGNHAESQGGGLMTVDSDLTLVNVIFDRNTVDLGFPGNFVFGGGGLYNLEGRQVLLTNVAFQDNQAVQGHGGGLFNYNSDVLSLRSVTFQGNTAGDKGGGMYTYITNPTLENVTFLANRAVSEGGGLFSASDGPLVNHATFYANTAGTSGGAMNTTTLLWGNVRNSIVWGNTPDQIPACSGISYSVVEGETVCPGMGNTNRSPLLGAPGDYGSTDSLPGLVTVPLLPGSSAIDAADPAYCSLKDQRGVDRPQGAGCDIGAYEARPYTLLIEGGDGQSTVFGTSFRAPLSVKVSSMFDEPVDGGQVVFQAPGSGASAYLSASSVEITGSKASVNAVANPTCGAYNVTASMPGAAPVNFHLTNTQSGTTTALQVAPNSTSVTQILTLTASVNSASPHISRVYGGTVAFFDGVDLLAEVALDASGQAVYSTSELSLGEHTLSAVYNGSDNFTKSTSLSWTQTVEAALLFFPMIAH